MSNVGQVIPELASAIGDASQAQRFVDLLNQTYGRWNIGVGGIHAEGICVLPRHLYRAFLAGEFLEGFPMEKPKPPKKAARPKKVEDPVPIANIPQPTAVPLTFEEWQLKRQMEDTQKVSTKAKKKKEPTKATKKTKKADSAEPKKKKPGRKKKK
jgi:hypothetical protein